IFESYAMLESFVRGKAFDYIFKDLILEVKLKKTSTTQSYKAYGRILRSFLEKNLFESLFLPNENVLKSAIRYGEWSIAKLVSGSDFSATLSQIDDMNRLFDRNEKDYGNIRDNKWFDLSD